MKDIEEGSGKLIVSGGDGAVDLEVADHALDTVAFAVDAAVPADRGVTVGAGRDDGTDAVVPERGADGVVVVALVGNQVVGPRLGLRLPPLESAVLNQKSIQVSTTL